jgi:hypothetical protein
VGERMSDLKGEERECKRERGVNKKRKRKDLQNAIVSSIFTGYYSIL